MGSIPTVSILIPTYQYGRFLTQAIESVLSQDYTDFELLISDDNSTDNSAAIIRDFATRDSRIRPIFHSRNLGMVNNWNFCLSEAKGKYIKFLFGDDTLPEKYSLRTLVQLLDANPEAVMASSARRIIDVDSKPITTWSSFKESGYYSGQTVIAHCIQTDKNLIGEPSCVIFRRSSAARYFDPSFKQLVDQEFWFYLLTQGGLVYTTEAISVFRKHASQQTSINQKNQVTSAESTRIMARYFHYFESAFKKRSSYELYNRLFKHIYYARKDSAKSAASLHAQNRLLAHLTRPGYMFFLFWHRLSKPFINLRRSFGRT